MSLFRKPKKIQRRVFTADDDDEADAEPQAPPPPVISKIKDKPAKTKSLLSFADEEEEDGEVFKVKKSKQSNRWAKRKEKEKKKSPDEENNKNHADSENCQNSEPMDVDSNHKKPEKKKKVTLEGLILSGREALAADGAGDLSEEEIEGVEEDDRGFHRYRAESVRAALAVGGHIPDAALIHAARKTRQQARELGGDYIPVTSSEAKPGSRLIRDDGSGDDDDEDGRIEVRGLDLPSDKPKRGTAAAPTNEELDSEPDEWEEQQIKKAMPAIVDITGEGGMDMNPFTMVPCPQPPTLPAHLRPLSVGAAHPPTSAHELVDALKKRLQELRVERDTVSSRKAECMERLLGAARIRERCQARCGALDAAYKRAQAARGYLTDLIECLDEKAECMERLLGAARIRERCQARCGALDAAYKRAQAARGYLTDLIECLDEKMPQLEALESRALALHRRRCDFLTERRRADVRDQAQDVLLLAARPGCAKPVECEAKTRRAAEREGRRRARRLAREAAALAARSVATPHREGDSSDDELSPAEAQYHKNERESIRQQSASLFMDALPAWRDVRGVCAKLSKWRRREPALYTDAYVADCLPKLLAPYVRHQLILWNPLADEDNEDYERMDWYRCLMMYGVRSERVTSDSEDSSSDSDQPQVTEESVRTDSDLFLVPTIIAKVVLPKVTELVSVSWDPICVRACIRLRQLVLRVCAVPGAGGAAGRLDAAVKGRLLAAKNADLFLPALPPQLMDGPGGVFWRRCLGAGVRLLRSALALTAPPPLLRADPIVMSLLETLCTSAGAAPPQLMSIAASALAETLPRSGQLRTRALARIKLLAALAVSRLQTDNPMHLKALEQARNVIAEAKATE